LNYRKKLSYLVLFATVIRLVIAGTLELGNDEVYYWTYALHPQWSYFDHPPITGWLIRLTTLNLLLHNELSVRIGAVISSAVCTILIYKTGTLIKDRQAAWYAALLYTASIYGSIIAGTFILPDSPQMVFWLWSVFLLIKIEKTVLDKYQNLKLWLLFGISTGLCIMSKVHGVFLWVGVALYAVFFNKSLFREKSIYLSAFVTLLIISPIIIWNIQNNFVTYTYHGNRVSIIDSGIHIDGFIRELAGELFYNNPFNFLLIWSTVFLILKGKLIGHKKEVGLLLCCGLPLILIFLIISLFKDTLPHWSGPGYSCLILLTATRLTSSENKKISRIYSLLKFSIAFIIILSIAGILIINFFPGTLSAKKSGDNIGDGDFTLDMYGWKQAGIKIDSLYKKDIAQNIMPAGSSIIVNKWFPAAHIDFYIASLTGQQTFATGNLLDLHQYYWYNQYKKPLKKGDAAYFIVPSNLYKQEDVGQLKQTFDSVFSPAIIPVYRSGIICKKYYIFRLKGYRLFAPGR